MDAPTRKPRYRFGEFTLSPARRLLLRSGRELPLIPRYFDLLRLLVERRGEAVHRREILEVVWDDVVVSDGALSQAVRSLRRTLGDDPREPIYIRTVQRHGYRFVYDGVVEEPDDAPLETPHDTPARPAPTPDADDTTPRDPFDASLDVLLAAGPLDEEGDLRRRQAAETLHEMGTKRALARLDRRPGHALARAYLREARWDVPGAGEVPLLGQPGALSAAWALCGLRFRRAVRLAGRRWAAAAGGGAVAGVIAGTLGGAVLRFGPDSTAGNVVLPALPIVGGVIGGCGAAGVGAGLAAAEAVMRSARGAALVLGGAAGGGVVGALGHLLGLWTLEGLFGRDLSPLAGGFEGLVIGAATGLGYALATPRAGGGMATPRGAARWRAAAYAGLTCAMATALLGWNGSYLGAMSLDFMARSFPGSQVGLDPLAHLLNEATPGPLTRVVISAFEGLMFGAGAVFGLTRRPR